MHRIIGTLAGILLVTVLVPGCTREMSGAAVLRTSAMNALPAESIGLVVFQIDRFRRLKPVSDWMKDAAGAEGQPDGAIAAAFKGLGDEVLGSVNRLGLAIVPEPSGGMTYGAVLEGDFGGEEIREVFRDGEIVTFFESADGNDLSAIMLSDESIAVGPRRVIERMSGKGAGDGLVGGTTMRAMLEKVQASHQVWGAIDTGSLVPLLRREGLDAGPAAGAIIDNPVVNYVDTLAFQGTFEHTLEIDLIGETGGEENARLVEDTLRVVVAFSRMGASQSRQQEWLEILDGLRIEQHGNEVMLHASISEGALKVLAAPMSEPGGLVPGLADPPAGVEPGTGH